MKELLKKILPQDLVEFVRIQRSEDFTAKTLTHIINGIYQQAGIAYASSHSGRRSGLKTLADK